MLIIRQWGGLGNQMFIYAFARAQEQLKKEVKIDVSYYKAFDAHGSGYIIPEVFPFTKTVLASDSECADMAFYQYDFFHRGLRKIGINKKTYVSQTKRYKSAGYNEELMHFNHAYIEGYFQSEKYFEKIKSDIRKEFQFCIRDDEVSEYLHSIERANSVSVHVRRGDYLSGNKKLLFETDYYRNSIDYIYSKINEPLFVIYSDDIAWCKEYFSFVNGKVIYVDNMPHAYYDMYLMSKCKHNIIADSSFSWWGAWLNNNADKIVLCPAKWPCSGGPFSMPDITPDEWEKIQWE